MALELNGTNVVIKDGASTIVGQMEATATWNGTPIDISTKDDNDFIRLMDGELAGKQLQISGTLVYNDNTTYRQMRLDAEQGNISTYTLEYLGSGATTDEQWSASMIPTQMSDAIPMGDKITTSITFVSTGTVTRTAAV